MPVFVRKRNGSMSQELKFHNPVQSIQKPWLKDICLVLLVNIFLCPTDQIIWGILILPRVGHFPNWG